MFKLGSKNETKLKKAKLNLFNLYQLTGNKFKICVTK